MNYIVCRNCKRYVGVNANVPLDFDKCNNCGHTLEFAGDEQELQLILRGIDLPEISYNKVCASCKSINPRETGICLYCGGTDFQLQYDADSYNKYINNIKNINQIMRNQRTSNQQIPNQQTTNSSQVNPSIANNWIFRIIAIFIGLIDFLFFVVMGIQLILGDVDITTDPVLFAQQNIQSLSLIVIVSLILAGLLAIFVLPKMSYKDSFKTSSLIGVIIGVIIGLISMDVSVLIIGIIVAALLTGFGGLIGEFFIQKLTRRIGPGQF